MAGKPRRDGDSVPTLLTQFFHGISELLLGINSRNNPRPLPPVDGSRDPLLSEALRLIPSLRTTQFKIYNLPFIIASPPYFGGGKRNLSRGLVTLDLCLPMTCV